LTPLEAFLKLRLVSGHLTLKVGSRLRKKTIELRAFSVMGYSVRIAP